MLISENMPLNKTYYYWQGEKGHFIMVKYPIEQEDSIIFNLQAL